MKKVAIAHFLKGGTYTCFHINTFWCNYFVTVQGHRFYERWEDCVKEWMQDAMGDKALFANGSNVFVVGQDDVRAVSILQQLLAHAPSNQNISPVAFTMQDV